MMMLHPAHAMLLASQLHRTLVDRARAYRLGRRTAPVTDCLIPVAPPAARPCRPDPRRSAARPTARHRLRSTAVAHPTR
ncbi:MAG TPA: hypothetical protein VIL37_10885 [Natronosporangium sp.]